MNDVYNPQENLKSSKNLNEEVYNPHGYSFHNRTELEIGTYSSLNSQRESAYTTLNKFEGNYNSENIPGFSERDLRELYRPKEKQASAREFFLKCGYDRPLQELQNVDGDTLYEFDHYREFSELKAQKQVDNPQWQDVKLQ